MSRHRHEHPTADLEPTAIEPPKKEAPFLVQMLIIAVTIPVAFWLRFGVINSYAIAVTGFFLLLGAAVYWLPRLSDRFESGELETTVAKPGPFDKLGVIWLLSIPFAPFAMWALVGFTTINASNWSTLLFVKTFLCVIVPCVCVLPLLRFLRRKTAHIALLILFLGTAFPVSVGWASMMDLIRGPEWQSLQIKEVERVYTTYHNKPVATRTLFVHLADGRVLEGDINVIKPHEGPARGLVLRSLGLLIAVDPPP